MKKKMQPKTKAVLCRASSGLIGAGVPIAVLLCQYDFIVQRADTTISAVGVIALIVGAVSFKDTILKFIKSPNALKVWAILFVLAILVSNIIEQVIVVSLFGLIAQGACVPLNILDKKYTKLALDKEEGNPDETGK